MISGARVNDVSCGNASFGDIKYKAHSLHSTNQCRKVIAILHSLQKLTITLLLLPQEEHQTQ